MQKQSPPPSRSLLRAHAKKIWGQIPWDFLVALIIPRAAQIEFYGSTFPIFILLWSRLLKQWLARSDPDVQNLPYPMLIWQGFTKLTLVSIAVPTETTNISFSHLLSTGKLLDKTVSRCGRSTTIARSVLSHRISHKGTAIITAPDHNSNYTDIWDFKMHQTLQSNQLYGGI